jgi:peptide/nickel transport system substrate-binding protein
MRSSTRTAPVRLGLAVALTAALALTGCVANRTTAAGAGNNALTAAILQAYTTPPDPDINYDGPGLNIIQNVYEGLVKYEDGVAEAKIVPSLASAWQVSADGLTYTFTLRRGVTFHDGTPLTSAAVAASVKRRGRVDGGPAYMTAGVANVATPDDSTAVFTLKAPNSAFLDYLASPFGLKIIGAAALTTNAGSDFGQTYLTTHDAGTGPYQLTTTETGVRYVLTAYDKYWGAAPSFTTVQLKISENASATQLELERGEIDAILGNLNKPAFESYAGSDKVVTSSFPNFTTQMVYVNPKSKVFGTVEDRRLLFSAIDTSGILSAAMGSLEKPTTQLFPPGMLTAGLDDQGITYDKAALDKLVTSGIAKGKTIRIGYPPSADSQSVAEELAARLSSAGLPAEAVKYASGTIYKLADNPAAGPDLAIMSVFPDAGHPDSWARIIYTPKGGLDLFGVKVDGVEAALDKALSTTDRSAYGPIAQSVIASRYWFSTGSLNTTLLTTKGITKTHEAQNLLEYNVLHFAVLGRG